MRTTFNTLALAMAFAAAPAVAQVPCFVTPFGAIVGTGDDVVLPVQNLGFSFPFNGTTYDRIYPVTNGFCYLGNAASPVPTAPLCCIGSAALMAAALNPMLCPFYNDLNMIAGQGAVMVDNSATNRCIVTWSGAVQYSQTRVFDLQMQIYSTGEVLFFYGPAMTLLTTTAGLVGMSPGSGAAVPPPSNFAAAPFVVGNTNYEIFSNLVNLDVVGQTLDFIPTGSNQYLVTKINCAASNSSYGVGCISAYASFYENFVAGSLDLGGTSMTVINTGGQYTAISGLASYVAPSAAAVPLVLTDDSVVLQALAAPFNYPGGSTSSLSICSNGFVSVAPGNTTGFTPTVATMLNAPAGAYWGWHDYNPVAAGSGQVKFEESGGVAYITWDGVFDFAGTTPNIFQLQFDTNSGNVSWVFQAPSGLGNGYLVGYSPAGASADGGNKDLSAVLAASFTTGAVDVLPLVASASPTPRLGATVQYQVVNVPVGTLLCVHLISFAQLNPGLDLGFIGAPTCSAYVVTAAGTSLLLFGAAPTFTSPVTIPSQAFALGLTLYNQFASLSAGVNALGVLTSNGINSNIQVF
ncbi:MAG: hypothetical protein NT107_01195 [Planctomycetota bacterium]|nr:hypothetical protein [Planctomycetota bacterium]